MAESAKRKVLSLTPRLPSISFFSIFCSNSHDQAEDELAADPENLMTITPLYVNNSVHLAPSPHEACADTAEAQDKKWDDLATFCHSRASP
jgi:hypothetical protein